jgi:hypothetical protein
MTHLALELGSRDTDTSTDKWQTRKPSHNAVATASQSLCKSHAIDRVRPTSRLIDNYLLLMEQRRAERQGGSFRSCPSQTDDIMAALVKNRSHILTRPEVNTMLQRALSITASFAQPSFIAADSTSADESQGPLSQADTHATVDDAPRKNLDTKRQEDGDSAV